MLRVVFAVALVLSVLIGSSGDVRAQAQAASAGDDVEALIEQGIALREQQRDEEAVGIFRRARVVEDTPRVRTQLGLALLANGEFVEAYELLSGALLSGDPWVESRRQAIEGSFASAGEHVGIVEILGGEPGGVVSVNGQTVGSLPMPQPIHVLVGRAVVEVSLEGFHRFATEVSVQAGRTARLRVSLVPRTEERVDGSSDDGWVLPLAIGGGALLLGGVIAIVVVATLPTDPPIPNVIGSATTLTVGF